MDLSSLFQRGATKEKMQAIVKKLHADVENAKSPEEKTWTTRHEVDSIRFLKAFELTIQDHAANKFPTKEADTPTEDGSRAKVFTYGDEKAGRATSMGGKAAGPICVDCFLNRALEHWSDFEDLEEAQLMSAFGSWDLNGDGKLQLEEFTTMLKYSNPTATQRKITRAYQVASAGGEHVDKDLLASTLLAHGLTLLDRPEDEAHNAQVLMHQRARSGGGINPEGLDALAIAQLRVNNLETAASINTVEGEIVDAVQRIGTEVKVISGLRGGASREGRLSGQDLAAKE